MTSKVDIANVALRKVAATPITSFDEGSKGANVVSDLFDATLTTLLRSHNWNFAVRRCRLARLAEAPAFGFAHAYRLPGDWLRTVSVHDDAAGTGIPDFREEGGAILTDAGRVYLRYVARVEDPNLMSADFRDALADQLAMRLAAPMTHSNTLREAMTRDAKASLMRAKSSDALGDRPDRRPVGSWAVGR